MTVGSIDQSLSQSFVMRRMTQDQQPQRERHNYHYDLYSSSIPSRIHQHPRRMNDDPSCSCTVSRRHPTSDQTRSYTRISIMPRRRCRCQRRFVSNYVVVLLVIVVVVLLDQFHILPNNTSLLRSIRVDAVPMDAPYDPTKDALDEDVDVVVNRRTSDSTNIPPSLHRTPSLRSAATTPVTLMRDEVTTSTMDHNVFPNEPGDDDHNNNDEDDERYILDYSQIDVQHQRKLVTIFDRPPQRQDQQQQLKLLPLVFRRNISNVTWIIRVDNDQTTSLIASKFLTGHIVSRMSLVFNGLIVRDISRWTLTSLLRRSDVLLIEEVRHTWGSHCHSFLFFLEI